MFQNGVGIAVPLLQGLKEESRTCPTSCPGFVHAMPRQCPALPGKLSGLRARRGLIPSRKGNDGRVVVQLPAGAVSEVVHGHDAGMSDLVADLTAEVSELRTGLVRAKARLEAAEDIRRAEVAALRELADRLTAELATARLPWWRRLGA